MGDKPSVTGSDDARSGAFTKGLPMRAALFAISGRAEAARVEAGRARAVAAGYRLSELPAHGLSAPGQYLAGDDEVRRASLAGALAADADFLWALRGGYGATRLSPLADFDLAGATVVGFSDVTALLAAVHAAGGRAIHGPVLTSFGAGDEASVEAMAAALASRARSWALGGDSVQLSAPVIGGNTEVLSRLVGTPEAPNYAGRVVVLEEVGEPWYRSDRSLTQLLVGSDLCDAAAVVFGEFHDCPDGVAEALAERLRGLGLPVLTGAPVGHGAANHAFVWGETAHIDGQQMSLGG